MRRIYVIAYEATEVDGGLASRVVRVVNVSTTLTPPKFAALLGHYQPEAQVAGSGIVIPIAPEVALSRFVGPWWYFGYGREQEEFAAHSYNKDDDEPDWVRFDACRCALDELIREWLVESNAHHASLTTFMLERCYAMARSLERVHRTSPMPPPPSDREHLLDMQARLQSALVECDAALERAPA